MQVLNIHSCKLEVSADKVGALLDSLSSSDDPLWPWHLWPQMKFDRPLSVGARGGHGPIRYTVAKYEPGKLVKFCFTGPRGFDGYHGYEVIEIGKVTTELRQTLKMNTHGPALFSWPFLFCPLHDALIEDSLTKAQLSLGFSSDIHKWSLWVRCLRWILSRGKSSSQSFSSGKEVPSQL